MKAKITTTGKQQQLRCCRRMDQQNSGNHPSRRAKRKIKMIVYIWDNIKPTNIHIMRVPEGEERERGREPSEEIIGEKSVVKK